MRRPSPPCGPPRRRWSSPDPAPGAKAGAAAHPARAVAGPGGSSTSACAGMRRNWRGHAPRRALVVHRGAAAREVHRRGVGGDGPADGDEGPADHRARARTCTSWPAWAPTARPGACRAFGPGHFGTPISENAFAGLGGGLALDGRFRPVVEFMYPDFLVWVAADQVCSTRSARPGTWRSAAGTRCPSGAADEGRDGVRVRVAAPHGPGRDHFATSPGWRIMAASTPFDYVGPMKRVALAVDDPVLMLEHVDLYGAEGEFPVDDLDYQIPLRPGGEVRRAGSEVTVLTYLSMVAHARRRRSSAPASTRSSSTCGSSTGRRWTGNGGRVHGQEDQRGAGRRAGGALALPTAGGS